RTLRNRQHMALADIPTDGQPARLDSWKEIAEYLRRDVRTATRWESQGLPVHRVGGGHGRSVYALTHEIDAWLAGHSTHPEAPIIPNGSEPSPAVASHRLKIFAIAALFIVIVISIGAAAMSSRAVAPADLLRPDVAATGSTVTIGYGSGTPRVIYQLSPGAVLREGKAARIEDIDAD